MIQDSHIPCTHCGLPCDDTSHTLEGVPFCCAGCLTAFRILKGAGMDEYYRLNTAPGIAPQPNSRGAYYTDLDDEAVACRVCDFNDGRYAEVTFRIPQIHCSSCIWLLENLHRMLPGIRSSRADFFKKTVSIGFERDKIALSKIALLLDSLGYAPWPKERAEDDLRRKKNLLLRLGVAGFCFGNVMLLSLPEYLAAGTSSLDAFRPFFSFLNLLLSLPVLLFSASDFFISAGRAFRAKAINIDVPLAIGLASLFVRSLFDIAVSAQAGYLDSFTGLVFFLLIGRAFKEKTFDTLNFERDYESYFPIAVTRISTGGERLVPLAEIRTGDHLRLRNNEIIPADCVLQSANARIDYSFVTGEPEPQYKSAGDPLYAGGRQIGESIEVIASKPVSQSRLTRLWNNADFKRVKRVRFDVISNKVGRAFTWGTLVIAGLSGLYWSFVGTREALGVVTSVLLVACPCAMALGFPFVFGTAMRQLGRHGVFLKNMNVLETAARIDALVFDKTGTITHSGAAKTTFIPAPGCPGLNASESALIRAVTSHSVHPLSLAITASLPESSAPAFDTFRETPGQGITATVNGHAIKIGGAARVAATDSDDAARVRIDLDGRQRGTFVIAQEFRHGLAGVIRELGKTATVQLLSGDAPRQKDEIASRFFSDRQDTLHFNQTPDMKMAFVSRLRDSNRFVGMVGDGLNDAGALRESDLGIAVVDDINAFSPASDVIFSGTSFEKLPAFFAAARASVNTLRATILLSLFYNAIGLGFAVSGRLSPLVSALLMPASSISVMLFASLVTRLRLKKLGFPLSVAERREFPRQTPVPETAVAA